MSLQQKFSVLIGLLSLTAAVSLGGAVWSADLLDREVAAPFTATTLMSRDVRDAIRETERLRQALREASSAGVRADARLGEVESALRGVDRATSVLGELDYGAVRVGLRTVSLLRESTVRTLSATREWMITPEAGGWGIAAEAVGEHLALLRRVETQATESAELAVSHVQSVRSGILMFQGVAVITAVLAAFLALMLHRRWIVEPVERLRRGTERLAAGDLTYRVPESGSDELSQLGREVNQMSATVVRMQAEAVEHERFAAVGQVVRRLAHNIRNPLAGIRGLAETSLDDAVPGTDIHDAQQRIITTVDRFDAWLTGFLRTSSPNRVVPERRPVADWLESCLAALRPMAESRGVRLELRREQAPEFAWYDPAQLEQALVALVTNAVEETSAGGAVVVSAKTIPGAWTLVVEDDGRGVDPEVAEKLFQADFTTKPGGHGIGLTAARWIVRRHRGMITAGRADPAGPCTGARFAITLPIDGEGVRNEEEVDRAERVDT